MTTPAEDHLALQKLATEYANAIDAREWDRLDRVFLPDARIDYTASGGDEGPYAQIKPWLAQSLKFFKGYMHLMGNFQFTIDGDRASGQVACFNPMVVSKLFGGGPHTLVFGIWYHDTYVRTPDGWRIATRKQQLCYEFNLPLWMRVGRWFYAKSVARKRARQAAAGR